MYFTRRGCRLGMSFLVWCAIAIHATSEPLEWHRLPDLPDPLGVAGPFVGVHHGGLIVAGGANFPQGPPWRPTAVGGKSLKTYHHRAYVLVFDRSRSAEGSCELSPQWVMSSERLARPIGYGVSVDTEQGVLCIGGEWQEHTTDEKGRETSVLHRSKEVFLLHWDCESCSLAQVSTWRVGDRQYPLPPLPRGVTSACGAKLGDSVYLAGGDCGEGGSTQFLRLDLSAPEASWRWEELPTWPGPPRSHAVGVEAFGKFFLLSGRSTHPERGIELLSDAYCFDPSSVSQRSDSTGWKRIANIAVSGGQPTCVMGATATADANGRVLVFGGDSGIELVEREQALPRQLKLARTRGDDEVAARLRDEIHARFDNHQGFSRRVLEYDVARDTWRDAGKLPFPTPVTTTAARWNRWIILPSGETRPGIRTNQMWALDGSIRP